MALVRLSPTVVVRTERIEAIDESAGDARLYLVDRATAVTVTDRSADEVMESLTKAGELR